MNTPLSVGIAVVLFVVVTIIINRNYRRRMRALAAERSGESICQFVRSLPYRHLDTGVIRRVYETIQSRTVIRGCRVPIRATDHCIETLKMDPEDFENLVVEIADHCGRSLDGYEQNPFYGRAETAGGLVQFLCAQAKTNERAAS
jgi:hypothetical protein